MTTAESGDSEGGDREYAVVLDYLPHGHADDDRPQYQKSPVAYALDETEFRLVELTLAEDADVNIGDRVAVAPEADSEAVTRIRDIDHEELSRGGRSELEYGVEDIVDADEDRFIEFYNDAQPITLRLHQLNLLPGIGKKLRNKIIEERKRGPFESFEELEERISGLHNPKELLVERIVEELRDEDLKYKTFVGREER